MSLNKAYKSLTQNGVIYTIAYYLAIPTLLFVQVLGCGKELFDPKPWVVYYSKPELPTDLLPYNEYLLTMKYIVEVRDAQFA